MKPNLGVGRETVVTRQRWRVTSLRDKPGVVHVSPESDQFEHRIEPDGECWCGPWSEIVEGGVIVHHPNLTERARALL